MIPLWVTVLKEVVPILVALVGIIPTIIGTISKTNDSIKNLQTTLDNHIKEDENEKARNMRYRILRFYDEICEGRRHSESHFEDILDDISDYEEYCQKHPDFKNSRGTIAMKEIEETYKSIKRSGKFLSANEKEKNHEIA